MRKVYLVLIGIVILVVAIFGYIRFVEPNKLVVKKYQVADKTKFSKIVFFSDTHFGKLYNQKNIERIVDIINQQNSDIVIFGGDFFDYYLKDQDILDLSYLSNELAKIEAKYKIAIYGNHDYGAKAYHHYRKLMEESGFTILCQSTMVIDELNLQLIGIDDMQLGISEVSDEVLKNKIKSGYYNVAVGHEPDLIDNFDDIKIDMMLAGHSHGGQLALPYFGALISNVGSQKYNKGMYNEGDRKVIVSTGVGVTKLPVRLCNVPEIVVIEMGK